MVTSYFVLALDIDSRFWIRRESYNVTNTERPISLPYCLGRHLLGGWVKHIGVSSSVGEWGRGVTV